MKYVWLLTKNSQNIIFLVQIQDTGGQVVGE